LGQSHLAVAFGKPGQFGNNYNYSLRNESGVGINNPSIAVSHLFPI